MKKEKKLSLRCLECAELPEKCKCKKPRHEIKGNWGPFQKKSEGYIWVDRRDALIDNIDGLEKLREINKRNNKK
jgi:hypothetical protein